MAAERSAWVRRSGRETFGARLEELPRAVRDPREGRGYGSPPAIEEVEGLQRNRTTVACLAACLAPGVSAYAQDLLPLTRGEVVRFEHHPEAPESWTR